MKGFFLYLVSCTLIYTAPYAEAASLAFQDAFHVHVKVRQLEEEISILSQRTDLESDEKARQSRALSAQLTSARIEFHSILRSDRTTLSPWELKIVENVGRKARNVKEEETSLELLSQSFPRAREFSPLEWQVLGEWFGQAAQDSFLNKTYSMEAAPTAKPVAESASRLVWVIVTHSPLVPKAELDRQKSQQQESKRQLEEKGYKVTEIPVSPFSRIEDQAEELYLVLIKRAEEGPFVLLSSGSASAILLKALDLNPALLGRKELVGWLNLNGELFGKDPATDGRKPASIAKTGPSYKQDIEAQSEQLRLRHDRLERQPPLGAKFKILNLVTLDKKFRPTKNLRECLVPEGRTFYLSKGNGFAALEAALPALTAPAGP